MVYAVCERDISVVFDNSKSQRLRNGAGTVVVGVGSDDNVNPMLENMRYTCNGAGNVIFVVLGLDSDMFTEFDPAIFGNGRKKCRGGEIFTVGWISKACHHNKWGT